MQCIYSQYFWAQNDVPCQARAAGALEKALGVSESAATSKAGHFSTSLCDSVWRVPSPESKTASGGDGRGRARPGTTNLGCRSAGDHQVPGQVCVSARCRASWDAAPLARQVKEELGKFQGEVCGQLQDTTLCIWARCACRNSCQAIEAVVGFIGQKQGGRTQVSDGHGHCMQGDRGGTHAAELLFWKDLKQLSSEVRKDVEDTACVRACSCWPRSAA